MILKRLAWLGFYVFVALTANAKTDQLKFGDFLPASTITNSVIIPTFIERVKELSGDS